MAIVWSGSRGSVAGYAINPARDFGPRVATVLTGYGGAMRDQNGSFYFWVPVVAPVIGGVIGGALYKYGIERFLPPADEPGADETLEPHSEENAHA